MAAIAIVEFTAATPPAIFDGCIPIPRPPVARPAISAYYVEPFENFICYNGVKEKHKRMVSNLIVMNFKVNF